MATPRPIPLFSRRRHTIGQASAGRLAVLYDGACSLCRNQINLLRWFDNSGRLDMLDFQEPSVLRHFPQFYMDALMKELHVVDDRGNHWRGGRAVERILQSQQGIRSALAWLWYLPGFAWFADREYKRVADSRYTRPPSPTNKIFFR